MVPSLSASLSLSVSLSLSLSQTVPKGEWVSGLSMFRASVRRKQFVFLFEKVFTALLDLGAKSVGKILWCLSLSLSLSDRPKEKNKSILMVFVRLKQFVFLFEEEGTPV